MARDIRGINEDQELDTRKIYKRQIPFWKQIFFDLTSTDIVVVFLCLTVVCYWIYPQYADICTILSLTSATSLIIRNGRKKLFIALPKFSHYVDYGIPLPGRTKFAKADGIVFLGNEDGTNKEIWARDVEVKTHMLVLGTTGSGKTVSLESLSYNYFAMDSGLVYVDPKADPKLGIELFVMSRRMGRDDDFRAMNFITSELNAEKVTPFRSSHTINPFAFGSADSLVNLITSLLPKSDGANSVFQQKAQALINGLIPVLVSLRDKNIALPMSDIGPYKQGQFGAGLSIKTIRDYLDPVLCVSLCLPTEKSQKTAYVEIMKAFKEGRKPNVEKEKWPECCRVYQYAEKENIESLISVLSSLNMDTSGGKNVTDQNAFLEQYGYAKGYFAQTLVSLSGTYGHIFNVSAGEIDMQDVLLSRRILVCMLPSLQKSPTEIENLGKIVLSSIKNAVSIGLGSALEGLTEKTLGALPSAARCPSGIVVDEYAAIMTPGFATILTQARSLGFAAVIASQDYAGMKGADEKEAEQIIANTKIKLFMTIVEAKQTWELIRDLFGKAQIEEMDLNPSPDKKRGAIRQVDRVTQEDIMGQIEGEYHIFYRGRLARGATPYMIPNTKGKQMRIGRMVRVDLSRDRVLADMEEQQRQKEEMRQETQTFAFAV